MSDATASAPTRATTEDKHRPIATPECTGTAAVDEADLAEMAKIDFGPVITAAEVEEYEANVDGWGRNRRIMLSALTRSREQLVSGFRRAVDDGREPIDAIEEALEAISKYETHLRALLEFSEVASARLLAAASAFVDQSEGGAA